MVGWIDVNRVEQCDGEGTKCKLQMRGKGMSIHCFGALFCGFCAKETGFKVS